MLIHSIKLGFFRVILAAAAGVVIAATAVQAESHKSVAQSFNPQIPTQTPANPPLQAIQLSVFVVQNGAQTGPFNQPELVAMVAAGTLRQETLVWHDGLANWVPATNVPAINHMFAAAGPGSGGQNPPPPPPPPEMDAAAFLSGTWVGGPFNSTDELMQSVWSSTTTYNADLTSTFILTSDLTQQGITIRQIIRGKGTYKAEMQGANTIFLTPEMQLEIYTGDSGPSPSEYRTAFTIKIIDQNTIDNDRGNRFVRQ